MNDFERKLSEQAFRTPPPEWREEILGSATRVVVPPAWTWRDWFWPSPQAWGALAALWILLAALGQWEESAPAAGATASRPNPSEMATFLSFHNTRDFQYVLNLYN